MRIPIHPPAILSILFSVVGFLSCSIALGQTIDIKSSERGAVDRPKVEEVLSSSWIETLLRFKHEQQSPSRSRSPVRVTPDGKFAVFITGCDLRVWSLRIGEELRRMDLSQNGEERTTDHWYLGLSPDGTLAVTTNPNGTYPLQVWHLERGEEIHRVDREQVQYGDQGFTFSADGKQLVVERIGEKHHLDFYDTQTWRRIKSLPAPDISLDGYGGLRFSNSGDWLLAISHKGHNAYTFGQSHHFITWNVATGQVEAYPTDDLFGEGMRLCAFSQAPNGHWVTIHIHNLAASGSVATIIIWEEIGKRKLREWKLPKWLMVSNRVSFTPDSRKLVVTNTDFRNGLHGIVLDVESGAVAGITGLTAATMLPDGKHMIGVANEQIDIWSLETRQPVVRFVHLQEPRHWATLAIGKAFTASPDVIRFIRDQDERTWKYKLKDIDDEYETAVDWMDACHRPEIIASTLRSIMTPPRTEPSQQIRPTEEDNGIARHLFFLGMGIAKHKYEEYNLAYCDRDVQAVAATLKKQQGKLYGRVHTQVYTNEQATRDNLEAGLNWVAEGCQSGDTVVVMFAGHGLKGRRGLYYLPHDGDFESLAATCLNWDKVGEALQRCKAEKILFLSDACHAGAFGKSTLPLQEDLVNGLVKAAGVMLLASSSGTEESFEVDKLRHGVFTATLLKGLEGPGDANQDQQTTLGELADYVIAEVPIMTQRNQHPCIPDVGTFDRELVMAQTVTASTDAQPSETKQSPVETTPTAPKPLPTTLPKAL